MKHGVPAQMQGAGGHIHWYFADEPVSNYRAAFRSNQQRYAAFISVLSEAGFLVAPKYLLHHAISSAHDQADLDQLVDALDAGLAAAAQVPA
jgi:glutamate-1-semialdehyde 2,1-aminomutase